ncbi:MAG: tRNA (adenosine(37)-N6)-threonylcarbamoyltransferase complex dimerization subunit type 1 TsaB [Litoreibacter sp.]
MRILAFDTSAAHCAVALLSDGKLSVERLEPMLKGQAERLMGLCQEVLTEGGTSWRELDAIGVGVGPGNFTGIRISVSAARGLSVSLGIPAIGVPVFDALAYGIDGPVIASIDARQNKIYAKLIGSEDRIETCTPDSLPDQWTKPQITCVGHQAEEIAAQIGGKVAQPGYPLASAIALIAEQEKDRPQTRPAPLYVRPPDAAPPRDTAPQILHQ